MCVDLTLTQKNTLTRLIARNCFLYVITKYINIIQFPWLQFGTHSPLVLRDGFGNVLAVASLDTRSQEKLLLSTRHHKTSQYYTVWNSLSS